jgi:hypothetical protein
MRVATLAQTCQCPLRQAYECSIPWKKRRKEYSQSGKKEKKNILNVFSNSASPEQDVQLDGGEDFEIRNDKNIWMAFNSIQKKPQIRNGKNKKFHCILQAETRRQDKTKNQDRHETT